MLLFALTPGSEVSPASSSGRSPSPGGGSQSTDIDQTCLQELGPQLVCACDWFLARAGWYKQRMDFFYFYNFFFLQNDQQKWYITISTMNKTWNMNKKIYTLNPLNQKRTKLLESSLLRINDFQSKVQIQYINSC